MQDMNDWLYQLENRIGLSPKFYYTFYARRYPFSAMKVTHKTDICIEGFPRSANSYATVSFKLVNHGVKVGHHLHVAAQAVRAVSYKIPTMVVLRAPEEAVASFMVFQNSFNAPLYLNAYTQFHQRLKNISGQILFISFETVTTNMNICISELNSKFNVNFETIPNLKERQDEIIQKLKGVNARFFDGQKNKSMYPDKLRETLKETARQYILAAPELVAARNIYAHFKQQAI